MGLIPAFEQFLAQASGLTPARALELYRAGYPWPLFTTEDIRKIGLLAQAKGLYIDEALAEVERTADADHNEMLERLAQYARVQSPCYVIAKEQAVKSLPCIDEAFEHMIQVIALTHEKGNTILQLFIAIQRWAITHPDWDPAVDTIARGLRLVT